MNRFISYNTEQTPIRFRCNPDSDIRDHFETALFNFDYEFTSKLVLHCVLDFYAAEGFVSKPYVNDIQRKCCIALDLSL